MRSLRFRWQVSRTWSTRQGDVFSYLYFDPNFIKNSIELGQKDAQRHLDSASPNAAARRTQ